MHSLYGNVVQRGSGSSGFSGQECHIESEDDPPESASTGKGNSSDQPILQALKKHNEAVWKDNASVRANAAQAPVVVNGQIVQTEPRKAALEYYAMSSSGSDSGLSDSEAANQGVRAALESPTPTPSSPSSGECTPTSLTPVPSSPTFAGNHEAKEDSLAASNDAKSIMASPSHHPSLPGEKMPMLGKSLSWVSPKLQARVTKTGCGLFCIAPVRKNEYLIVWTGKILSAAEALAIMETHEKHYILQIGDGFYQTPLQDEREPADLTNHSCQPTAGFGANSPICLTAMRDMNIGEEVVFDYGMCETDERLWEPMECACGAPYCRGLITAHDWKREELWERYQGFWAPHVQKKINALRAQQAKELEEKGKEQSSKDANTKNGNEANVNSLAAVPAAATVASVNSPSFLVRIMDFVLGRFGLKRLDA